MFSRASVASLAVVLILTGCGPPEAEPSSTAPVETGAPSVSPTSGASEESTESSGLPLVSAGIDGVRYVDVAGRERWLTIDPSGPLADYFTGVQTVMPDGVGGLVFQHSLTPPPWPNGSIVWLRAGSTMPTPVVAPPQPDWPCFYSVDPLIVGQRGGGPVLLYAEHRNCGLPTAPSEHDDLYLIRLTGGPAEYLTSGRTDQRRAMPPELLTGYSSWAAGTLVTVRQHSDESGPYLEFTDSSGNTYEHPHNPHPEGAARSDLLVHVAEARAVLLRLGGL